MKLGLEPSSLTPEVTLLTPALSHPSFCVAGMNLSPTSLLPVIGKILSVFGENKDFLKRQQGTVCVTAVISGCIRLFYHHLQN